MRIRGCRFAGTLFLLGHSGAGVAGDEVNGFLSVGSSADDETVEVVSGRIVVASVNGEHTIKRLRRTPKGVWLEPANPKFERIWVGPEAELHVFGVVQHAIYTLR